MPAPPAQPARHRQQRPHHRPLRIGHFGGVAALAYPVVTSISELAGQAITRVGDRAGLRGRNCEKLRQQGLLEHSLA